MSPLILISEARPYAVSAFQAQWKPADHEVCGSGCLCGVSLSQVLRAHQRARKHIPYARVA
eukprot:scaffold204254_cov35-Prasinocladus_malaysianus.AAC.2